MDIDYILYLLANGLTISVIGVILIATLPASPVQAQTTLNSYLTGTVQECLTLNDDINCVINEVNDLRENFDRIYENQASNINLVIINEKNGEIEYFSNDAIATDEIKINSMINSCNLFNTCIVKYYLHDNERYKIILM